MVRKLIIIIFEKSLDKKSNIVFNLIMSNEISKQKQGGARAGAGRKKSTKTEPKPKTGTIEDVLIETLEKLRIKKKETGKNWDKFLNYLLKKLNSQKNLLFWVLPHLIKTEIYIIFNHSKSGFF